jgi:hypothetical protein
MSEDHTDLDTLNNCILKELKQELKYVKYIIILTLSMGLLPFYR